MKAQDLISQIDLHLQYSQKKGKIPLIAIIGPTASGKTTLSIELAAYFNGEIVSADSRQIYQEMDIGTAKASPVQRARVKHHLLDVVKPNQEFSLANYQKMATPKLEQIFSKGKIPFLVGGTGLYISAITQSYELPSAPPDPELRRELEQYVQEHGSASLHQLLTKLDPESAQKIHPHNLRYVIRAIEIVVSQQQPKTNQTSTSPFEVLFLGIDWPRDELYYLIDQRVDEQMANGLLVETQTLLSKYQSNLPAMSSLGYRELGLYLNGEISLEQAVEIFKRLTRNYAKRQLTWFRKYQNVYWIAGAEFLELLPELQKLNQNINQHP